MTLTNPGAAALAGKRVAVVGLGKSGMAVLDVLARLTTAELAAFDVDEARLDAVDSRHVALRRSAPDNEILAREVMDFRPDLVVPAPAIPETGPLFAACEEAGVEIAGEIELAWRLRATDENGWSAPWLCVTGTNGKTTTVSMLAAMLQQAGIGGEPLGNVGNPAIAEITRTDDTAHRAFALELSSFQLRATSTIEPLASVCLNFADDHLEWHGSREAYRAGKARVYDRVRGAGIFPHGNSAVAAMVREGSLADGARAVSVTLGPPREDQLGFVQDAEGNGLFLAVDRGFIENRATHADILFTTDDLRHLAPDGAGLPGHVALDALAAAALARAAGVGGDAIAAALRGYRPGAHRIELVGERGGVRYVDDSKATNAHAAMASLGAQADGSVVWIVGGLAKGARFGELVEAVGGKIAGAVVIGVDQEPWREAFAGADFPVRHVSPDAAEPMREAVAHASAMAGAGQTVLLAPACASMDQFASYAARGEAFAREVKALP